MDILADIVREKDPGADTPGEQIDPPGAGQILEPERLGRCLVADDEKLAHAVGTRGSI